MIKNWVIHFLLQLFEPPTKLFVEAKYISVANVKKSKKMMKIVKGYPRYKTITFHKAVLDF